MALSKKHFEKFASLLQGYMPDNSYPLDPEDEWESLINDVADIFEDENPLFDRRRFYLACGANERGEIEPL